MRGPVAQGIEQRFPGPCVAGSNPARPASRFYLGDYASKAVEAIEDIIEDHM